MALLAIALVLALKLPDRWIGRADAGLRILALALLVATLATIVPAEVEKATTAPGRRRRRQDAAEHDDRPEARRLLADLRPLRLGSRAPDRLRLENALTPWLEAHGFDVLADSHANYVGTALSLSTTVNLARWSS